MTIKKFELYHGAVLTKLTRNDTPVTLRMIEKDKQDAWCAYLVNDEVNLYIKYGSKPSRCNTRNQSFTWNFTFGDVELQYMRELWQHRSIYLALVCGQQNIQSLVMYIGFIYPFEIDTCLDLNSKTPEQLYVCHLPQRMLRVWGNMNSVKNPLLVANNRLEMWNVPGS